MFGGYVGGNGNADLWQLNLLTSSWTNLMQANKHSPYQPYPTAFNVFTYFYTNNGADLIITTMGGIHGGYKKDVTFTNSPGGLGQSLDGKVRI